MKRGLLKIAKDLDKEKITEEEARTLLLSLLGIKETLPVVDEEELNKLIRVYNRSKSKTLIDFVCRVWNRAYNIGYWKGRETN